MVSSRELSLDLATPVFQTTSAVAAAHFLGRLGHLSVTLQSAALIAGVASVASALAQRLTSNEILKYLTIPLGVGAGAAVHQYVYPAAQNAILDPKVLAGLTAILVIVKFIFDAGRCRNCTANAAATASTATAATAPTDDKKDKTPEPARPV